MSDLDLSPAAIRAARLSAGRTQSEFAALIGVHAFTLRRWEHGTARPTGLSADRLRAVLTQPLDPPPRANYRAGPRVRA